ncbi:MAG: outer membrane protein assembly factor BamA [Candidatus Omnitrophica bacterium]|nr:outer membrane protein assembly factor BamA [Candidatus Omnitrophota bacterium]MDE2222678.1 outer membrane protein assembly factor BamA [Candidatus Omnitrophota bacterium]
MPKCKVLLTVLFGLCLVLSGAKVVSAQSDSNRQQKIDAALNAEQTAQDNSTSTNAQQPAADVSMNMEQQPAAAAAMPEEAPAPKIVKAIDIQGNKSIGIAQVLARIKTRVGEPYQEAVVSDDLKRLYNTGHFSDVQIDHEDFDGGYRVIVKLKEKPIVEEISFSKIRYYNPRYLMNKMKTKKDKFLDNKDLKDDINMIQDLYKKKGLTQATVDAQTSINEATNKAGLHFIIREGYKMRIKRIHIYGNVAFRDKKIIKVMKSRWAWLFNSGLLKPEQLDQDMTAIQSFYEQNGYLDAKASYQLEPLRKGWVNVNVTIQEGIRYYVGDVTFSGNSVLSEAEIRSHLKNLKPGKVFSHEKMEEDLSNIREDYFNHGYITALVEESPSFNPVSGRVDIKIDIKEGMLTYINQIKIQGNAHTRDIVIRRELRMYPGDRFDGEKLKVSKQRLKDLGYFEDVGYDIEDTDRDDYKDLIVQVKEAKTGTFSFGGGYSTIDRLVGFVEVEQKNFDISNWSTFTGGGQDLRLRAQIGSVQREFLLSFTEPWLFDHPVTAGFDAYLTENLNDNTTGYAYTQKTLGGDLRLGKAINDNLSVAGVYRLEHIEISNLNSGVSEALLEQEGSSLVSSLGVSVTNDYRDSRVSPTRGWTITNSADLAGGPLGGDKNFWRLQTGGAYYIPFTIHDVTTVLEISARTGIVQSYPDTPDVPIFERYFAGGQDSIRGYDERSVGPIDPNTNDAVGGDALLVGSVEYTVPIISIVKGAVFFDTGNVWSKVREYGSGGTKSGTGVGLRVKTPIGPIKLDYGIPLNSEPGQTSKSGKFYFSVSRGF